MCSIFALLSCNRSSNKSTEEKRQDSTVQHIEPKPLDTTVVDYTNTIPVTMGYIVSRDTVVVRQAMSEASKAMEKVGYGQSYEVIEQLGDWVAVWSRDRYPYKGLHQGEERLMIAKRKVFLPKSAIGKMSDLKLYKEDIPIVNLVQIGENESTYYEHGSILKEHLSFELVTEQVYMQKKKDAVTLIVRDTLVHRKKEGVLTLPTAQKNCIFKDSPPEAEESRAVYEYVGHIPSLAQYIVSGSYYESTDYTLVDMHTGEKTVLMVDFPCFSPDGKHIISLYTNPYEGCEDVELYRITGQKIERVASFSFVHWMAGAEAEDIFFARDNSLYLPVFYNQTFWTEEGQLSKPTQFMRIIIK